MDFIKGLVAGAQGAAVGATDSVSRAAGNMAGAIPSVGELKQGLGRALIVGGRALIDPQTVVGELAIEFGRMLATEEVEEPWLVLEATQSGLNVLARGSEDAARELLSAAVAEKRSVMLCKAVDAQTSHDDHHE